MDKSFFWVGEEAELTSYRAGVIGFSGTQTAVRIAGRTKAINNKYVFK